MTSSAKGNAFEKRVFEAVKKELKKDLLGVSPKRATPYLKKGYYSRDRDSDIIVDVSIEVWLPKADRWSMLWVCECKDYASAVPVDDVEEFKAKLDQIAGANKKGILAVSGALQDGAIKYARSNGIGIIRLLPDEQVEHLMYFQTTAGAHGVHSKSEKFFQTLTEPDFVGVNKDFYASSDGLIFDDWESLLKNDLRSS